MSWNESNLQSFGDGSAWVCIESFGGWSGLEVWFGWRFGDVLGLRFIRGGGCEFWGVARGGGDWRWSEEEVAPMDVIVTSSRTLLESCGTFSHSHPWRHPIICSSLPEKNRF